jgi:UTP--glucose-1-phosphate uridylyltransferase
MNVKKAVFPVAGLGTRFLPATKSMPKEMLPVVDKPIIQYAVEEALASGIEEIIFVTGKGKGALEDHFDRSHYLERILRDRGKTRQLQAMESVVPHTGTISYTRQSEPLGLGHAILCARNIVGNEPFAVLLADDLIQSEVPLLGKMIREFDRLQSSVIAVVEVESRETAKYGILDVKEKIDGILDIKGLVEKPPPEKAPSNYAIIGRYILTPEIFDCLENQQAGAGNEIQLTDALSALLHKQPIYGYTLNNDRRFDCGSQAGFLKANLAFAMDWPDLREELMPFLYETANLKN